MVTVWCFIVTSFAHYIRRGKLERIRQELGVAWDINVFRNAKFGTKKNE